MNDVIYWILYALVLISLGCNITGCVIVARSWKRAKKRWETAHEIIATTEEWRNDMRVEVAEEIFDDIEGSIATHAYTTKSEDYSDGVFDTIAWVDSKIDEVKEKYIPRQEA